MYHIQRPVYHQLAPKVMSEVDFTPIFLALLPLFLSIGTLLGLGLQGSSTTTPTVPSISVNVNATSSASGGDSGTSGTNNTQVVPLILFTNGTFTLPLLLGGATTASLFGLGNLFFPFFGIGRSLQESIWETGWSDFVDLGHFLSDLYQVDTHLRDEEERLACYSWILCSQPRRNILLDLLRYEIVSLFTIIA